MIEEGVTVLLVYMMTATQHVPPQYPAFFTVYPTKKTCEDNAERYMKVSGHENILINAKCVDAREPALVPYLHDVPELAALPEIEV